MSKKTLVLLLSVLAALVALVVIGVVILYREDSPRRRPAPARDEATRTEAYAKSALQAYPLLQAVPSDAAMLATFGSLREAVAALTDSTQILPVLLGGPARGGMTAFFQRLRRSDLGALRHSGAILSLHYSGDLVPVLLVEAGPSPGDTTEAVLSLLAAADSSRLSARLVDGAAFPQGKLHKSALLLISPSETLLTASLRHLESGASVLDSRCFPEAASGCEGADALFVNHAYSDKICATFLQRPFARTGAFFGKLALWTAFRIKERTERSFSLEGFSARPGEDPVWLANFIARIPGGEIRCAEVLPAATCFAVALSTERLSAYLEPWRLFLDADRKLAAWRKAVAEPADSMDVSPEKWALQWDIKEVVRAGVSTPAGVRPLVLVRPGRMPAKVSEPAPCPFAGYPGRVFGSLFDLPAPASYLCRGGWVLIGAPDLLAEGPVLGSVADFAPAKGTQAAVWYCPTVAPATVDEVMRKPLADAVHVLSSDAASVPVVLSARGGQWAVSARRLKTLPEDAPVQADTTVLVPEGPFRVTNSATGKPNTFGQAPNGSLSLRDENGKGLWAIPFSGRLCGRVETIDYYGNGKLQFLFAAGSRLYLIDRLGRIVNPFPVDLGKSVRIGPAAYDFTGAHGYTAVVLHTDNTIGMYDLHGRAPKDWKGIAPEETIKSLPELLESGGHHYWAVRTGFQTLIYGFYGGEPLLKAAGEKRIAPDSPVAFKGGAVVATARDGKERTYKLP